MISLSSGFEDARQWLFLRSCQEAQYGVRKNGSARIRLHFPVPARDESREPPQSASSRRSRRRAPSGTCRRSSCRRRGTLRDEKLLESVNTPLTASRDEWAEAYMELAKLIIEGFETKAIRAR
ncbi:MAG: hypothetical protein R6X10_02605, partial [Desulfobacterales bacterium]